LICFGEEVIYEMMNINGCMLYTLVIIIMSQYIITSQFRFEGPMRGWVCGLV